MLDTSMALWWCKACGRPCGCKRVDNGVGAFEYEGRRGVDRRMVLVSSCCEATLLDETGQEVADEHER